MFNGRFFSVPRFSVRVRAAEGGQADLAALAVDAPAPACVAVAGILAASAAAVAPLAGFPLGAGAGGDRADRIYPGAILKGSTTSECPGTDLEHPSGRLSE